MCVCKKVFRAEHWFEGEKLPWRCRKSHLSNLSFLVWFMCEVTKANRQSNSSSSSDIRIRNSKVQKYLWVSYLFLYFLNAHRVLQIYTDTWDWLWCFVWMYVCVCISMSWIATIELLLTAFTSNILLTIYLCIFLFPFFLFLRESNLQASFQGYSAAVDLTYSISYFLTPYIFINAYVYECVRVCPCSIRCWRSTLEALILMKKA